MKNYAKEEGFLSHPRELLLSSFKLQNGTLIAPLLLFFFQHLGFVCTIFFRSVDYTPKKCFNCFVQSAVNEGRRQSDEDPNAGVVAENETPLQKLIQLPDHELEQIHCNKVPQRQNITCRCQKQTRLEARSREQCFKGN